MRIVPGAYVRHPTETDWGHGRVQSVDKNRVTVNFTQVGKVVINSDVIRLGVVDKADLKRNPGPDS